MLFFVPATPMTTAMNAVGWLYSDCFKNVSIAALSVAGKPQMPAQATKAQLLAESEFVADLLSCVRWAPLDASGRNLLASGSCNERGPAQPPPKLHVWEYVPAVNNFLKSDDSCASVSLLASAQTSGGSITSIEFVGGSNLSLVVATDDGVIRLFKLNLNSADEKLVCVAETNAHFRNKIDWHLAACASVALSRGSISDDGLSAARMVASTGADGRIVFSSLDGRILRQISGVDGLPLTAIQWRSDSEVVVAGLSGRISVFDMRSDKPVALLSESNNFVNAIHSLAAHATAGHRLVTGGADGTVLLWDMRNALETETDAAHAHDSLVWSVGFAPGGRSGVWSCSEDGSLCVWAGEHLRKVSAGGSLHAADVCEDGLAALASDSGHLFVVEYPE